ncbi:MAG: DUF2800 domain-containing protein [Clostridiales bacterium]|jgi:hypothetical protein|nr:DUF2800 domain-containing protein [Clostridiales bacterium]
MPKHALLSASSAERWINCPPSARLEEKFPDKTSIYAEEGSLAHAMGDLINRYNFKIGSISGGEFISQMEKLKAQELYKKEMDNFVEGYCNYVFEEYCRVLNWQENNWAVAMFEEAVDFSEYVPDGFGTVDCAIVSNDVIEVIDFKYGKGVLIPPENNKQMMLYALGVYLNYGLIYDIKKIGMSIYQPRLGNISRWGVGVNGLIEWAKTELATKAKLAFEGAGEFKVGGHCKFCKANAVCRARAEHYLKFLGYGHKKPNTLTDSELPDILAASCSLKDWAEDVAGYMLGQAVGGKKYNGFKLVEGKRTRRYTDEREVEKLLKNANYDADSFYSKKLLGITAMEALLTKKVFNELLGGLVYKAPGKPTLVPEPDKRPGLSSAAIDFAGTGVDGFV